MTMEETSALATWLAYGAISLFLVLVVLVVGRTVVLLSLLLIDPIRHAWLRFRGELRE